MRVDCPRADEDRLEDGSAMRCSMMKIIAVGLWSFVIDDEREHGISVIGEEPRVAEGFERRPGDESNTG